MPLAVFFSYSHKDEEFRSDLEKHLKQLERNGLILPWHDRRIEPGDNWRDQIDEHIRSAHLILLLISPDFIASDYCCDVEMRAPKTFDQSPSILFFRWPHRPSRAPESHGKSDFPRLLSSLAKQQFASARE